MAYWTRRTAAERITAEFFQVAERTLLEWNDVPVVILNGRAHGKAEDWRQAAKRRMQDQLARQGADLPPLVAARRATAIRMARRRAVNDLPPAA
jgi:hypothetical protein